MRFNNWNGERTASLILLAGAVLVLTVLAYPMLIGHVYVEDDLSAYHLPLRHFYHQCLHEGKSFLWMPNLYCGFYLQGEGQVGMCHPLHLLLYSTLPLTWAFNLELLLSYAFLFAGTYCFLRRWAVMPAGAILGTLLFTFCSFNFSHYIHLMIPAIMAHTPWLLLAADTLLRQRDTGTPARKTIVGASLGIVLLTASQLLLGFPQCVYFSLLIEGCYVLCLLPGSYARRSLFVLGMAKILALGVAAVQLLPSWDALYHSFRAAPTREFMLSGAMHPMNLFQFLNPYLFNRRGWDEMLSLWWDPPYFGAFAPTLLMWAIVRRRKLTETRVLLVCALTLGIAGIVFALGRYVYVYELWAKLPIVSLFRNGSRHIVLFHAAMALVVALAYSDLLRFGRNGERMTRRESLILLIPAVLSITSALVFIWLRPSTENGFSALLDKQLAPDNNIILGAAIIFLASMIVLAASQGFKIAAVAVAALTILDVGAYSLRHLPHRAHADVLASVETPPEAPGYRIDPDFRPVSAYTGVTMKGFRAPLGWAALIPRNELDYYHQRAAQRVAGVRWRKARMGGPPELAEAAEKGLAWLELPDALPRARLLSKALVSAAPSSDIERIDVADTALAPSPVQLDGGPAGEAFVTVDEPGHIVVRVSAPAPRLLVVNERFHEGWSVCANERPLKVIPAYGDFLGCVVDEGECVVNLQFAPASFYWGLRISVSSLVAVFAMHAAWLAVLRLFRELRSGKQKEVSTVNPE